MTHRDRDHAKRILRDLCDTFRVRISGDGIETERRDKMENQLDALETALACVEMVEQIEAVSERFKSDP